MSKILANEAAKSKYERVLKRSTSTAVLVLFAQGLSGCLRSDGSIDGPSISGVAFDGPLSRAKVFVDANNNNLLDGSEDWTWTNFDGSFTLSTNATGPLVVVGTSETTDASSGASVDGLILTAPTGSSVISPATTVAKKIADDAIDALGANPTEEQIQAAIDNAYNQAAKAFGLSEAFTGAEASESLATFNPFSGNTSSTDAVAYAQAAAKVVAAANSVATAVSAAGGADKGDTLLLALNNIADQAAAAIGELNIDVGAIVNAVDTTNVVSADLSTSISNAVARISTAIDSITDTNSDTAGDVLFVTQSILAESVEIAARGGSAANLELLANATTDVAALASTFVKIFGDSVGELSEDNELGEAEAHTLTGTLSITDPDDSDEVTYQFDVAAENITYLGSGEAKGSLTITSEGEWTYTVSAETLTALNSLQASENKGTVNAADGAYNDSNFGVREAFQVLVTDGNGDPVYVSGTDIQVSKIITVKIVGQNDAPTLTADFQTPADVSIAQGLELSDSATIDFGGAFEDVDTAEVLKFSAEGLPDGVSIDEDTGVVSGKPSSSAFGEYSVTVSVTDAGGEKVSALPFTITVTNTNDSPAVVSEEAESIAATEDAALSYDASALFSDPDIANGHDEKDALTYTVVSPVEWLTYDPSTGALSGTPDNNDVTTEAFTIKVTATDKYELTAVKEISVTVGNTNDAPIAATADLGILSDTASRTITIADLAGSVTDEDVGDEIVLKSLTLQDGSGTVKDNEDNTFTYTPIDGETGDDITFAYTVSDKAGETDSSTATLSVVDAIPVGSGSEDASEITIAVSDLPGATIIVADDDLANKGTISEDGTTFEPLPNWYGTVSFNVLTADGVTLPGVLEVSAVNDAPVINLETTDTSLVVLDDGGSVTGTIIASDVETTDLTYTATGAEKGSVTFTEGGNYTYKATAGEEGADSFTITVSDGTTTDDQTQVVTVQIGAISVGSGSEDASEITIAVSDLPGATITVADDDLANKGTISEDGTTFEPLPDWSGTVNFNVLTADGETLPGVLVVNPVNDAPVIDSTSDIALTTDEDTVISGTITATDVETSAANLTYGASGATLGTVAFTSAGSFTYTPNADANGTDTFTVTVSDGDKTDTENVTVNISPINDETSFAPGAYQWVSEKMTYADAQANAEKLGGNLASVTSAEEATGMYDLVSGIYEQDPSENRWGVANDGGGISYVWLGASDAVAENTWVWETGEVFDYANWGQAEPDNEGDQDALGLGLANWPDGSTGDNAYGLAGQWNDINAGNLLTSIIEYEDGATVGVREGAESANSIIYVAIADDVDSDAITLTLGGTDAAAFTIDSSGDGIGIVRLKEAADYETKTSYSFELIATEGGVSTNKAVTLNVDDVVEPAVLSANLSSDGNDHTVVLSLDATALSNSEFVSIEGFTLAFAGSGGPTSSNGITSDLFGNFASFSTTSREDLSNAGLSKYNTAGSFNSDIFGSEATWSLSGGDAVALASDDPVYEVTLNGNPVNITQYIGTNFDIGTLRFTTSDDVTDLDIIVSGSVTGNNVDNSLNSTTGLLSEVLTPITIDVI